jgi:hypothetical protein
MNTPVERKLVPITNFLSRNNLLVRFGIGIAEKPMTWEKFLEILKNADQVHLPSHVLYLEDWLQKISELPQPMRDRIVIQCTLGQELLDRMDVLRKVNRQLVKIDFLTDRAPTDSDLKILNELKPDNISFTFCPQQFYPLNEEIKKWKKIIQFNKAIYFHPKQQMIDPLYSQDEIEYFLPRLAEVGLVAQIIFFQITSNAKKNGINPKEQNYKFRIVVFYVSGLMHKGLILLRHLFFFLLRMLYPFKKIYWFLEYQYRMRIRKKS